MEVTRFAGARAFLDRAGSFLVAREAVHNLILGLAARLVDDPTTYGDEPYFAVAEERGDVVAVAMRTPPFRLIVGYAETDAAVAALADDAHDAFATLPGVVGPKPVAAAFAERWQELTSARAERSRAERIYEADSVRPPAGVPGRMRPYREGDRELAVRWFEAFVEEVLSDHAESARRVLDRRLSEAGGGLVVWEDGDVVSLAGYGGPTPNGVRIGPVYTPPERRRRGYASALTAALTQQLLDGGRRFCFLFTDLANPTSNSIYQQVGYRPVIDMDEWKFD